MHCGGSESSINPLTIATFARLRALSTKYNESSEISSRPFDNDRDGFVMGEGAGVLVLESLDNARKKGAPILGEVLGYGLSGDGHHMTAAREDGHGAFMAMKNALNYARLKAEDVSYVNCHDAFTPIGDKAEIFALKKLFQSQNLNGTLISSTKGSHGHLLGAAGAVEIALTVLGLERRKLPPSTNIFNLDEEFKGVTKCIIHFVTPSTQSESLKESKRLMALKNSFGFGGLNACVCVGSFVE